MSELVEAYRATCDQVADLQRELLKAQDEWSRYGSDPHGSHFRKRDKEIRGQVRDLWVEHDARIQESRTDSGTTPR